LQLNQNQSFSHTCITEGKFHRLLLNARSCTIDSTQQLLGLIQETILAKHYCHFKIHSHYCRCRQNHHHFRCSSATFVLSLEPQSSFTPR